MLPQTSTSQNDEDMTLRELYNKLVAHSDEQSEIIRSEIHKSVSEIAGKVARIDTDLQVINKRCLGFERIIRKNNIIIFGLEINADEDLLQKTLKTLNRYLETDLTANDVNDIRRVGKSQQRPVVLEFVSHLRKKSLFKNVKNLKGTGIGIANDLCKEDRERNQVLVKHLRIARAKDSKANIRGDKLYIQGKPYTAEELQNSDSEFASGSEGDGELSAASIDATAVNKPPSLNRIVASNKGTEADKKSPPKRKVTVSTRSRKPYKNI